MELPKEREKISEFYMKFQLTEKQKRERMIEYFVYFCVGVDGRTLSRDSRSTARTINET